jgi:hypothetical protein
LEPGGAAAPRPVATAQPSRSLGRGTLPSRVTAGWVRWCDGCRVVAMRAAPARLSMARARRRARTGAALMRSCMMSAQRSLSGKSDNNVRTSAIVAMSGQRLDVLNGRPSSCSRRSGQPINQIHALAVRQFHVAMYQYRALILPRLSMTYFEPAGRWEGNPIGLGIEILLRSRGRVPVNAARSLRFAPPCHLCPVSTVP